MTDKQINRHEMHRAVLGVLDSHADAWSAVPAMGRYRNRLEGFVTAVADAAKRQALPTETSTTEKSGLRERVRTQSGQLAGAVTSWAHEEGRPEIADAVAPPEPLANLRDAELAAYSEVVVGVAREHLPAPDADPASGLGSHGVTAAHVDALDATDDAFAAALATPREAIVAQKQATTDLGVGVRQAQRFLRHQLDGLVGFLSAAQPAFAQAYRDARVIVDRGTGHAVPDDDDDDEM